MRRFQILIEEEQYRFPINEAGRRGVSISVLLRELIDDHILSNRNPPLEQDALWDMVGIARGGVEDVSQEHDRYLANDRSERMSRFLKIDS